MEERDKDSHAWEPAPSVYVEEADMHPELVAVLAETDPALGERDARENYIFRLDKLRGCWREEVSEGLLQSARNRAIVLWPDGAPGAVGSKPSDIPMLYPAFPDPQEATGAALIVCPGGGFKFHAPWEAFPFAEWFREKGIAAFILQYRLLPYMAPAVLDDGRRAVRVVRARARKFGVDTNRIGVIGFSAGGYLAALVATKHDQGNSEAEDPVEQESCRPDATVLFYTPTNLVNYRQLDLLVLNDPEPHRALAKRYSPCFQVSEDTPPSFLYGLRADPVVPPEQLLDYTSACNEHHVPFELHIYDRGEHGAGVAFSDPRLLHWQELLTNWLIEQEFLE